MRYLTKLVRDHSVCGIFVHEAGDPFSRAARVVTLIHTLSIMYMTSQIVVYLNNEHLHYTSSTSDRVQEAALAAALSTTLSAVMGVTLVSWGMRREWGDPLQTALGHESGELSPPPRHPKSTAFFVGGCVVSVLTIGANVALVLFVQASGTAMYSLVSFGSSAAVSLFLVEPLLVFLKHQVWNQDTVWSLRGAAAFSGARVGTALQPMSARGARGVREQPVLTGRLANVVVAEANWESSSRLRIRAPSEVFSAVAVGDYVAVAGLLVKVLERRSSIEVDVDITPAIQSGSSLSFTDVAFEVNIELPSGQVSLGGKATPRLP